MEGVGEWASNLSLCLCRSTIAKDLELLRVVDFNCQDEVKRSLGAYMPPQLADDVPVYANLSSEGRRCSVRVFVPVPVNTEPGELLLHKSVPVVLVANRKVLAAREDGGKTLVSSRGPPAFGTKYAAILEFRSSSTTSLIQKKSWTAPCVRAVRWSLSLEKTNFGRNRSSFSG